MAGLECGRGGELAGFSWAFYRPLFFCRRTSDCGPRLPLPHLTFEIGRGCGPNRKWLRGCDGRGPCGGRVTERVNHKGQNSSTLGHCAIFSVTASCIAYPRVWSLVLYRGLLYSARNIVKQDPGRARQKSLYTAIANFTKPGAQNKGDLCSDPMTTKRLFEATLYFTVFLSSEDFLCERACLFFKLFCLRRFLLSGLSSSAAPNGIHP